MIGLFFQIFVEQINIFFVGHFNDPQMLAGVGMGNMVINMIWLALFMGLNGALETLVS
jgi:Na+-driven multidrug efflux pump